MAIHDPRTAIIEQIGRGSFDQALRLCRRALIAAPERIDLLHLLGVCLDHLGRTEDALEAYRRALRRAPANVETICRIAIVLQKTGRLEDAMQYADRALAQDSACLPAMMLKADILSRRGNSDTALDLYSQVAEKHPGQPAGLFNRSILLQELGRHFEARHSLQELVHAFPRFAPGYAELGLVSAKLGERSAALHAFDRAIELDPANLSARKNRAVVLYEAERHAEALADFEFVCSRDPADLSAQCGSAAAQFALGNLPAARARYARVMRTSPQHPEANWNAALIELTEGRLDTGWDGYEWRWRTTLAWPERHPREPAWHGEYVRGTLLLWGEQGIGDEIFFAAMIADASTRADALVVEADPRLVPVLARSFPRVEFRARGAPLPEAIACRAPIGTVGRFLRRSWTDVPSKQTGYLRADDGLVTAIRSKLPAPPELRLRIGLSWRSRSSPLASAKSIALESLLPVIGLPGTQCIDLQYGDTGSERQQIEQRTGIAVHHLSDIDNTEDIEGLAALICACDVIVTTSNATAHLAAALGQRVLLLLPYAQGTLWYWHRDRDDSPWYPTVTIYRQHAPGQWHGPIERAASALASELGCRPPTSDTSA